MIFTGHYNKLTLPSHYTRQGRSLSITECFQLVNLQSKPNKKSNLELNLFYYYQKFFLGGVTLPHISMHVMI